MDGRVCELLLLSRQGRWRTPTTRDMRQRRLGCHAQFFSASAPPSTSPPPSHHAAGSMTPALARGKKKGKNPNGGSSDPGRSGPRRPLIGGRWRGAPASVGRRRAAAELLTLDAWNLATARGACVRYTGTSMRCWRSRKPLRAPESQVTRPGNPRIPTVGAGCEAGARKRRRLAAVIQRAPNYICARLRFAAPVVARLDSRGRSLRARGDAPGERCARSVLKSRGGSRGRSRPL